MNVQTLEVPLRFARPRNAWHPTPVAAARTDPHPWGVAPLERIRGITQKYFPKKRERTFG